MNFTCYKQRESCISLKVAQSCPTLGDTKECIAHQAPLSMWLSRQEYWSGLPFPSPVGLLDPEIKPTSPTLHADSLLSQSSGNSCKVKTDISLAGTRFKIMYCFAKSFHFYLRFKEFVNRLSHSLYTII